MMKLFLLSFNLISSAFASGGESGRHYTLLQEAGLPIHVAGLLLVSFILVSTMWVARVRVVRGLRNAQSLMIPENKLTFFNFFDILSESLYQLTVSVLGDKEARRHYSFIGSIFVIIFASNLLGMIPGFLPPTDNVNTTIAFGFFVFIYYNLMGLKEHGPAYIKHFFGPIWWLAPLLFVIELVSHIVRPISLGLRLRGNIYGDHLVLSIFSDLVPLGVPVIFYGLGFFVCFIQAFVFTLLTMIYISLSTAHDH